MYFFYVIIFNDGFQAIFGNKMNKYHKKIISVNIRKTKNPRAVFVPHGDFQVICSIRLLRGDAGTAAALTVYLRHGIYGKVNGFGESVGSGI